MDLNQTEYLLAKAETLSGLCPLFSMIETHKLRTRKWRTGILLLKIGTNSCSPFMFMKSPLQDNNKYNQQATENCVVEYLSYKILIRIIRSVHFMKFIWCGGPLSHYSTYSICTFMLWLCVFPLHSVVYSPVLCWCWCCPGRQTHLPPRARSLSFSWNEFQLQLDDELRIMKN